MILIVLIISQMIFYKEHGTLGTVIQQFQLGEILNSKFLDALKNIVLYLVKLKQKLMTLLSIIISN